jgi:hypothetical protein
MIRHAPLWRDPQEPGTLELIATPGFTVALSDSGTSEAPDPASTALAETAWRALWSLLGPTGATATVLLPGRDDPAKPIAADLLREMAVRLRAWRAITMEGQVILPDAHFTDFHVSRGPGVAQIAGSSTGATVHFRRLRQPITLTSEDAAIVARIGADALPVAELGTDPGTEARLKLLETQGVVALQLEPVR